MSQSQQSGTTPYIRAHASEVATALAAVWAWAHQKYPDDHVYICPANLGEESKVQQWVEDYGLITLAVGICDPFGGRARVWGCSSEVTEVLERYFKHQ
jgi:hypothetical protein